MRKPKRNRPLQPFAAGLIIGYITTLLLSVLCALLLLLTDSAEALSGAASIVIMAVSCYIAGYAAGKQRRRNGMAAGALCGVLYMVLPFLISLLTLNVGGTLLIIKLLLCTGFGAAGGVVGVNSVK